jgi:NADPH:quinone reductase-like Zn-dependent oxidoreductase
VIDLVGGPYVGPSLEALAPHGRVIFVGTVGGSRAELNLATIMSKRLTLIGTVLRSRSLEEKIKVTNAFAHEVVPLLANKRVVSVIDRVFPLDEVAAAHRRMQSNENVGKIVLQIA